MSELTNQHKWRFFRAGGFDQVLLESGDDLRNLRFLDQKLWVALSSPAKGVQFDKRTLELIDEDNDGQIRAPELLAAIEWTRARLKSLDILLAASAELTLADIDNLTEEGERVLSSSIEILKNLGKSGAAAITLEDAIDSERIFAGTGFNGDGIITALSTDDEKLKQWIEQLMAMFGSSPDRSGEDGAALAAVDSFATEAVELGNWRSRAPFTAADGSAPAEICELWETISPKVEDYFVRCRMAAFDPKAAAAMNSAESDLLSLGSLSLDSSTAEIAALPLSLVHPQAVLDLKSGLNPAWQEQVCRFRKLIAVPLACSDSSLDDAAWKGLRRKMEEYEGWWNMKPASSLCSIDPGLLDEWHDLGIEQKLRSLIDKDMELATQAESIIEVERLLHYVRHLYPLLNNFVAFRGFYTRSAPGIFQCGTLYIDGRSCELCIPVADASKHAALATLSRLYLVYCDCKRRGGEEKMTIAAAVTSGDSDQIIVGRNGLFYDFDGNDWDATVTRIIDHPISLRQAFWSPYKRLGRMIGEQVQKMAAARSKASEERALASVIHTIDKKPEAKPAPPQQQMFDVGKFAGIFAAIGLAVGALGSALATTLTGFLKLQWWQMPLALGGLVLIISGPAIIIAWFKLRQRNLGPILDANGWAINARAKLNIPFGASLTSLAKLPEGSSQQLFDPFAEKRNPWKSILFLLLLVAVALFIWLKRG